MRAPLAFALLLAPTLAWSQDDPVRRALITQATQARDRGDHTQALALAREAGARRMSPSLRTFIAQEYAELGQNGLALDHARTCVREVEADPSLANRATLLAECRALVERLAPASTAPPPSPPPPRPAAVARPFVHPSPPPVHPPPEGPRSTGPGAGPWVVVGAGVASFGAAGLFYAFREDALAERNARCPGGSPCELPTQLAVTSTRDAQDRANTYNLLTNVAIGVGAAAVAGGLLWFLLGRPSSSDRPRAALVVSPQGGGVYVGVQGAL